MILDRFIRRIFGTGDRVTDIFNVKCNTYEPDYHLIEYSYGLCVQIVSNLVASCEKETFKHGERKLDGWYYILNVSPNHNQSAVDFWHKLVHQIFYYGGEALVIQVGGRYYVADSFNRVEHTFKPCEYTDIVVDNVTLKSKGGRRFENEVYYFNLRNFLKDYSESSASFFYKLVSVVSKQYIKKKWNKPVFEIPSVTPLNPNDDDTDLQAVYEKHFKDFIDADKDSVLVTDGEVRVGKYESVMGEGYVDDAPNIINFNTEVMQTVANMFAIPVEALRGQDVSLNAHINLFLRGFLDVIETEINRKRYGMYDCLKGSKVKITTVNIEKMTPFDLAKTNDLKLRSGIYNINEIRRENGLERINEEWADTHFMTLNYDVINKFMKGEQGSGGGNKNAPSLSSDETDGETDGETDDKREEVDDEE